MNSLIDALGLDWRILLAQFVNFSILIFVLWRFAYKPIFKLLEERRAKIAQGIKDSDEAAIKLREAEERHKEIVAESRKEANFIIEDAKNKAEVRYQEIIDKSKDDLKAVINDEKEKIEAQKQAAILEIKKKTAELIVVALEKVLGEKMDAKTDADLIARVVKDL
jgi:F-type H+-transporting ATPase subunit b